MPGWNLYEQELKDIAHLMNRDAIFREAHESGEIAFFYCTNVAKFVKFLRDKTRARELGAQHHALKVLLKYLKHGDEGRFEVSQAEGRLDIAFEHIQTSIEVRIIVNVTVDKVLGKLVGIVDGTRGAAVDRLWIAFFYKLADPAREVTTGEGPQCKYLLVFVDLDLMTDESVPLREQLIYMVEKGKEGAARKLGIPADLVVPVENIILVEALESEVVDLKEALEAKDRALEAKDRALEAKDRALEAKDEEIQALQAQLRREPGD